MTSAYDIALLTDSRYANPTSPDWYVQNILDDDALLSTALDKHNLRSVRVDWADPKFDWSSVRASVFRTTWDYYDRIDEFRRFVDRAERVTKLLNSAVLTRWNLDKHYLLDLEERGVRIPPTFVLKKGQTFSYAEAAKKLGVRELVIKPTISGAAKNTFRVTADRAAEIEQTIRPLLKAEDFLVQPFLDSVPREGELSLIVVGEKYTHAVRKVAKAGDFRVQDDHGGKVSRYEPTAEEIAFAEKATRACPHSPIYARVDIVRDNDGNLALMEWEGIEPELFLRFCPPAADLLAVEIAKRL